MTAKELKQLKHLKRECVLCDMEIRRLRESSDNSPEVKVLIELKAKRLKTCNIEKLRLEQYIAAIPDSYLRQMFQLKYGEGLSWTSLAQRIGCTGDSARMACSRYLKEKK